MNWTVIVITICVILAVFMVWKEYRRDNPLRLGLRIIATLLAAVALACIALPISYNSKSITGTKDGVLLTTGFNKDSLAAYQNSKLFTTQTAIQKANSKLKITLIADLTDIPHGQFNIASLHILGYGLNADELNQLDHFPIQFHPSNIPPGFITIDWSRRLKVGEPLLLQGKFSGNTPKIALILKGLNTTLDSVTINSNQIFQLKTLPKNTGRATYTLLAIAGRDTIEQETIPFEVEPAKPVKVLMLATSPDFENRFLKNWISQHGYGVTVRTAISKDKFSHEYFNMPQLMVDRVTPTLLDKFDLLVGDLSALKSLSSTENGAVQQQVSQKGLGIIVKVDSSAKGSSFLSNAFAIDRLSDKDQKPSALLVSGQPVPLAKLALNAVLIKPQANTLPLVTDGQNHIVANSTIYGSGKVTFTTLTNTYNWALSGNQNDYTALWSELINKASRKAITTQAWSSFPLLPAINEPAILTLDGPASLPMQISAQKTVLAFKQNALLPFSWQATFWPQINGWQQVTQNNIPVYWWYAIKANDWPSLHASEKIEATRKYANLNPTKSRPANTSVNVIVNVSKIYFYLLLLLCCTYLWLEKKL